MKIKIGPYKNKGERKIDIQIDRYDTWNMDHTLALIVLPMLKQLKKEKHGSPMVDSEDVPENLRVTTTEEWDDQKCFDFYHKDKKIKKKEWNILHDRWDWIMNEMIYAFTEYNNDFKGENKFFSKKPIKIVDEDGYREYHNRIDNGFKLFGKYFRGLWD
jgi:hypothetical protein